MKLTKLDEQQEQYVQKMQIANLANILMSWEECTFTEMKNVQEMLGKTDDGMVHLLTKLHKAVKTGRKEGRKKLAEYANELNLYQALTVFDNTWKE